MRCHLHCTQRTRRRLRILLGKSLDPLRGKANTSHRSSDRSTAPVEDSHVVLIASSVVGLSATIWYGWSLASSHRFEPLLTDRAKHDVSGGPHARTRVLRRRKERKKRDRAVLKGKERDGSEVRGACATETGNSVGTLRHERCDRDPAVGRSQQVSTRNECGRRDATQGRSSFPTCGVVGRDLEPSESEQAEADVRRPHRASERKDRRVPSGLPKEKRSEPKERIRKEDKNTNVPHREVRIACR